MSRILRRKKQVQYLSTNIENKQINCVEIIKVDKQFQSIDLSIAGSISSPYEGHWFRIRFEWPPQYPFKPLKCIFLDKIWNPYVDFQKNIICMDILTDEWWCPALSLHTVIFSIISLLSETKIGILQAGFMNPDAAIQMEKNYPLFFKHAKQLSELYSYKKKEIYTDSMRVEQEHIIVAQQEEIEAMKAQNAQSKKFNKKYKKIDEIREWEEVNPQKNEKNNKTSKAKIKKDKKEKSMRFNFN